MNQLPVQETKDISIRDLIVNNEKIDENICCGICQELAIDAKECNQCQHLFCQPCITEWKNKSRLMSIQMLRSYQIKRTSSICKKLKCPYSENGCQNICTIEALSKHANQCEFSIQDCPNKGCTEKILKMNVNQHQQQCIYRKWTCEKCQSSIPFQQQLNHDCITELSNRINNYENMIELLTQKFELSLQQQKDINQQLKLRLDNLEINNSKGYLCQKQHKLTWTNGTMGEKCTQCKNQDCIIRYVCKTCNEKYCQKCKPPQFKNGRCPLNHELKFQDKPTASIQCDFCECRPALKKIHNWNDQVCDFDVCDLCKKKFN